MNDEQKSALNDYEKAFKKISGQPTVAQGGVRAEIEYAEAYQGLVSVGLAPQLKRKYRP
jgi:hypothetical protein